MIGLKTTEFKKILNLLHKCTQTQYNGKLTLRNSQGKQWSLYYSLGEIVWATGGTHPYRRFRRCIAQNFPQININSIRLNADNLARDYWDYRLLENLYNQQQIKQEQINVIAENTIAEVLFELAQKANTESLICDYKPEEILEASIISTNTQMSLKQMQDSWKNWTKAGLTNVSPHLSPILRKPQELQAKVNSFFYKNFVNLINGKYTFSDLAVKMKQTLLAVTRSLLPYINSGITELVEIADLPLPVVKVTTEAAETKNEISALKFPHFYHLSISDRRETNDPANVQILKNQTSKVPLIACVDDSPNACKILEEIVTANALRFIAIQDPLQALPTLIQNKPDLIFLDLIMPVVNGYEICAQLRRSSFLSKTPVVILTGSDRLLDPVRSRVFGATEFMTKPVVTERVIEIIDRYIRATGKVYNPSNLAVSPF